jgi:hypothetical protein
VTKDCEMCERAYALIQKGRDVFRPIIDGEKVVIPTDEILEFRNILIGIGANTSDKKSAELISGLVQIIDERWTGDAIRRAVDLLCAMTPPPHPPEEKYRVTWDWAGYV